MKLLLAGGGTAGHINPALAIAGYVCQREPATQILYVGAKGGMEERLVPQAGYDFEKIEISGFQRKLSFESLKKNVHTVKLVFSSSREAKKIISRFQPDLCIGTGGYVSGPVIRQAQKMGIPTLIHEQNAFPGVTNKMLSKHADRVMLAIEDAKRHMDPNASFTVTGNPVRGQIVTSQKQASRDYLRLDNRPVILSFGGSLGARKINEAAADLIAWSSRDDRFQHIHAYGQYGKWFPELLEKKGVDLKAPQKPGHPGIYQQYAGMHGGGRPGDLQGGGDHPDGNPGAGKGFSADSFSQRRGESPISQRHGAGQPERRRDSGGEGPDRRLPDRDGEKNDF